MGSKHQYLLLIIISSCVIFVFKTIFTVWPSGQLAFYWEVISPSRRQQYFQTKRSIDLDPGCSCRKVSPLGSIPLSNRSTCSQYATDRGPGQKIISYTFFGKLQSHYYNGIANNVASIQSMYPGYIMRLYFQKFSIQETEAFQKLCDLFCYQPNLDLCDVSQIKQYLSLEK